MVVEQYAFVPADGGLLAVGARLPHVRGGWELDDLRAVLPGDPRYLRLAGQAEVAPEHLLRLRVFARVDARGAPPAEIAVPEALRSVFDRCVAELRDGPVPEHRAAWAREGWHELVEEWAGMPLEQVRNWPLSAVLRNGDVWFKAVFPLFHHEPAISEAIGLPRVLRADHERGWMLLEEAHGEPGQDHEAALRALGRVHRDWSTRVDQALALGAPDRRSRSALPPTLIHGDFHPGNVLGSTIIDWSDAAVANPLHDVNHYLLWVDDDSRERLLLAYGEAYGADVRAAVAACEAETYEYIAQSYAGITAALPDDEKWWFVGEESRWLGRASDVRAGMRPSRDT